ncbi:MAG TPA: helix-turn-helix domain-containing protein [Cyclobacteriaceae bacterium]|nr:helix-turn-helix domain-containing protein [Cyclobacteriaceae bacterium]
MTGGNETRQVYETALFKKLNAIRNDLAELEGVPPSFIVSDTTLVELATYLPHGRDELRKIYGFTDTKIERYEEYFLETVIDYCARRGLRSRIHLKVPPRRADFDTKQFSLDLFNRGYSIAEIAERRGLKKGTIETHLAHYVREGKLPLKSLVPPERAGRILSALKGDSSLTAIKNRLGAGYAYGEIRIVLAHREFVLESQNTTKLEA